jgi:hypothetical protein
MVWIGLYLFRGHSAQPPGPRCTGARAVFVPRVGGRAKGRILCWRLGLEAPLASEEFGPWSDHDKLLPISGLSPLRTLRKYHGSVFRPENRLMSFAEHARATVRPRRQDLSKAHPYMAQESGSKTDPCAASAARNFQKGLRRNGLLWSDHDCRNSVQLIRPRPSAGRARRLTASLLSHIVLHHA